MFPQSPRAASAFTATSAIEAPARPADCHLDLVLDRHPERPYVVLGRVSSSWVGRGRAAARTSEAEVMRHLARAACRAGAHVLFLVETSSQDHPSPQGRAYFVRSLRGTAVAAVYVRPSGRLEPPPTAPRSVIRVPGSLEGAPMPVEPAPGEAGQGAEEVWDQGIRDPWAVPAR
jgi:hypothetical protein